MSVWLPKHVQPWASALAMNEKSFGQAPVRVASLDNASRTNKEPRFSRRPPVLLSLQSRSGGTVSSWPPDNRQSVQETKPLNGTAPPAIPV
jgi:hypothetical protein